MVTDCRGLSCSMGAKPTWAKLGKAEPGREPFDVGVRRMGQGWELLRSRSRSDSG